MTSTQNTLRAKQNMEVLDVFKNLNSQVNAITKRQIAVFPDTLKPKTQRDLEVEVNVDKSVESLNNLLETRLVSLEFVLKNDAQLTDIASRPSRILIEDDDFPEVGDEKVAPPIPARIEYAGLNKAEREQAERHNREVDRLEKAREAVREAETKASIAEAERRGEATGRKEQQAGLKLVPFQRAYDEIITTGSVVSLWNNIVRFYQKAGLSRQSQEMVKVKVQDLVPNLEAILYGLGEAVDVLFSSNKYNNKVGVKVLELLRTQSIYQIIKTQVDTSAFDLISVSSMETAFKNIFASLSQDRRELLDEVASRGEVSVKPIRQIPEFRSDNFNQRIKALADEMGIDISAIPAPLLQRLRGMNEKDFEASADEALRTIKSKQDVFSDYEGRVLSVVQHLQVQVSELKRRNDVEIPLEIARLQENIALLDGDYKVADVGDMEERVEVPALPPIPDRFDFDENDAEGYDRAMGEWERIRREYDRANEINDQIENDNEMRDALTGFNVAQKEELKNDFLRRIKLLEDERDALALQIPVLEKQITSKMNAIKIKKGAKTRAIDTALQRIANAYEVQLTKGKGKPIDSRGLAGLGSHYGTASDDESESDEESDDEPMRFDDRRNDMYYSRPIRRK